MCLQSHNQVFASGKLVGRRCGVATKAFVLIETAVGKTRDVVRALSSLDGMLSVDVVTGPYDIIAVVEASDLGSIGDMVTGHVHTIQGIQRTVTCLAVGD